MFFDSSNFFTIIDNFLCCPYAVCTFCFYSTKIFIQNKIKKQSLLFQVPEDAYFIIIISLNLATSITSRRSERYFVGEQLIIKKENVIAQPESNKQKSRIFNFYFSTFFLHDRTAETIELVIPSEAFTRENKGIPATYRHENLRPRALKARSLNWLEGIQLRAVLLNTKRVKSQTYMYPRTHGLSVIMQRRPFRSASVTSNPLAPTSSYISINISLSLS